MISPAGRRRNATFSCCFAAILAIAPTTFAPAVRAAAPPTPEARRYRSHPVDTAHGDREFLLLWPNGAPGALGSEPEDRPKLTLYPAPAATTTGTGVVVCPGGGYRNLASDHEGLRVAEWLNTLGVSAFVLQYRVGPRYGHPAPLQDLQRAIRSVRARAEAFGVDRGRLGVIGFSAGGHLASTAATRFDDGQPDAADPVERMGSRPDFLILAYPVISLAPPLAHEGSATHLLGPVATVARREELSSQRNVTARTPPAFLFHTADDASVPVGNSLAFCSALHDAGVPCELHVFPQGRHGVGLAEDDPRLSRWPDLCAVWMRSLGLLERR